MRKGIPNYMLGGEQFFFPLIPCFICPLCPTRKSISADGFPGVNVKHGSNQMTVKDRSSRQRTRRSGLPGATRWHFSGFESVSASCSRLKASFMCDEAAALRDSPAWVFGLMLQWEDEETLLCRGRLSLLRTCVWLLEKPRSAVKIHSFAASTSRPWLSQFQHISSTLLCWCSPHHGFVWASSLILPPWFSSLPSASVCANGWVGTSLACH